MKKKILSVVLVPFMLLVGLVQTGCFGEFVLTHKLYDWNAQVAGKGSLKGRFINNLVFLGLCILPAYEFAGAIDFIVLNLIEFWTGTNPLAMNEGDIEQQMVHYQGKDYMITATKNQFMFEELIEGETAEVTIVQYCEEDMSWSAIKDSESYFLSGFKGVADGVAEYNVMTCEGMETVQVNLDRI